VYPTLDPHLILLGEDILIIDGTYHRGHRVVAFDELLRSLRQLRGFDYPFAIVCPYKSKGKKRDKKCKIELFHTSFGFDSHSLDANSVLKAKKSIAQESSDGFL
jgi:hypothetical protein